VTRPVRPLPVAPWAVESGMMAPAALLLRVLLFVLRVAAPGAIEGAPVSPRNLVRNPSIERSDPDTFKPLWWQPFINDYAMTSSRNSFTGDASLVFRLYNSAWVGCGQLVWVDQRFRADLEMSAHGAAVDLPRGRTLTMFADMRYEDGTSSLDHTMPIGEGTFPWTRRSMILHAEKRIRAVMIYVIMEGTPSLGSAYIDDVSLVELQRAPPALAVLIASSSRTALIGRAGGQHRRHPRRPHYCVEGTVCDTDALALHMHNHFLASEDAPAADDITLVTQCSPDRLQRIQQLARIWNGPISAAVYVAHDNFNGVARLLSLWENSAIVRKHVDFHLASVDARDATGAYPINALRNLAWEHARTDQLFLLDVDFMPNPGMRVYVRKLWPRLKNVKGLEKNVAYIVPGFESKGGAPLSVWPKTRKDVVHSVNVHEIQPVHADKLLSAHAAVNYDRWYKTENPYKTKYRLFFEPYMIVDRKDCPMYDVRFSGYGHDKSSHTFHLNMAGFQFVVLPEAFVVHMDHGVPAWRNEANTTRIWVNWYSFALEKEAELGGGGRKLYFAPEFWGLHEAHNKNENSHYNGAGDRGVGGGTEEVDLIRLKYLQGRAFEVVRAGASGGEAAALKAWKAAIQDVLQPSELSVLREMVVAFWSV
jgi:hypothetical protein